MELRYSNFDGLDVTFQGKVPADILQVLEAAKTEAQLRKKDVPIRIGGWFTPVLVAETGMRGGFAYRLDTGEDGEIWAISKSDSSEGWNIRASVKSLSLALYGYEGVKERIFHFLQNIKAVGPIDGYQPPQRPKERISRLDFCADFSMTTGFQPNDAHFIAHSHCTRSTQMAAIDLPMEQVRRGRRIETIRIGAMPGRQVTLYDKSREVKSSNKPYWWDFWGLDKKTFKGSVWRVEARAGKDELDKWGVKTFADFEAKAGDVVLGILQAIRYVSPNDDSNPARWPDHPLWVLTQETARKALEPYTCGADRKKIIADLRIVAQNTFKNLMVGMLPGYMVTHGFEDTEATKAIEAIQEDMLHAARHAPAILSKKHEQTAARYVFLDMDEERLKRQRNTYT